MSSESSSKAPVLPLEKTLSVFLLVIAFFFFLKVVFVCKFGLDLTDEGFYLNLISNPYNYARSFTLFGFFYHPLYSVLQGDIVLLRQCSIVVTFALATTLWFLALDALSWGRVIISFLGAFSSLLILSPWISTPSYNTLAFQAVLIAAIALLKMDKKREDHSMGYPILMGVAGWIAFMAKPTTAACLWILFLGYCFVCRKTLRKVSFWIATASSGMLLVALAFVIDGSVVEFIRRSKTAVFQLQSLSSTHSYLAIFRLDPCPFSVWSLVTLCVLFVCTALSVFLISRPKKVLQGTRLLIVWFAGFTIALVMLLFFPTYFDFHFFNRLQILAISASGMVAGLWTFIKIHHKLPKLENIAASVFVFFLPYAFVFGSNNNYWHQSSQAATLWILATVVLFGSIRLPIRTPAPLLPILFIAELVTVSIVSECIRSPYRQLTSLGVGSEKIRIASSGKTLEISGLFAQYIKQLQRISQDAGFQVGDPMVDLTGRSPSALFALGVKGMGSAWMSGGYPGSSFYAAETLKEVSCNALARAWLLTDPKWHHHLPMSVLSDAGLSPTRDFVAVGSANRPPFPDDPGAEQVLLRPNGQVKLMQDECEKTRAKSLSSSH